MTTATASKITLSPDQARAKDQIIEWWKNRPTQVLTMGGYAGTGKTTTIAQTILDIPKEPTIAFCCYTGKAASVLRSKLQAANINPDYCGTIHSLIYKPIEDDKGQIIDFVLLSELEIGKDKDKVDLIILDEASMVNEEIWNDLTSFGIPIIPVGDHGQLPPINGKLNLMEHPDIILEKIHRQAEGNPIIKLSMVVRETGSIPMGEHGAGVLKMKGGMNLLDKIKDFNDVMILSGYNTTRCAVNREARKRLKISNPEPQPMEKIICLKNNRKAKVFNGMMGTIQSISRDGEHWYRASIIMDDGNKYQGRILRKQFGATYTLKECEGIKDPKDMGGLFDWGYALTVWKAQGSESDNVVLIEERLPKMSDDEWKRFLYTGVTRARQKLFIIGAQ